MRFAVNAQRISARCPSVYESGVCSRSSCVVVVVVVSLLGLRLEIHPSTLVPGIRKCVLQFWFAHRPYITRLLRPSSRPRPPPPSPTCPGPPWERAMKQPHAPEHLTHPLDVLKQAAGIGGLTGTCAVLLSTRLLLPPYGNVQMLQTSCAA